MKIIIDIPEEWFCRLQNAWGWALAENVREAIKSGTILPKGHGRLIDADALEQKIEDLGVCNGVSEGAIDNAPTIIAADKEETI